MLSTVGHVLTKGGLEMRKATRCPCKMVSKLLLSRALFLWPSLLCKLYKLNMNNSVIILTFILYCANLKRSLNNNNYNKYVVLIEPKNDSNPKKVQNTK